MSKLGRLSHGQGTPLLSLMFSNPSDWTQCSIDLPHACIHFTMSQHIYIFSYHVYIILQFFDSLNTLRFSRFPHISHTMNDTLENGPQNLWQADNCWELRRRNWHFGEIFLLVASHRLRVPWKIQSKLLDRNWLWRMINILFLWIFIPPFNSIST